MLLKLLPALFHQGDVTPIFQMKHSKVMALSKANSYDTVREMVLRLCKGPWPPWEQELPNDESYWGEPRE